ncbi:unnamed protein product [Alternaria alternata]
MPHLYEVEAYHCEMAEIEAHTEGHEIRRFEPTSPVEQTSLPSTQTSGRGKVAAPGRDRHSSEHRSNDASSANTAEPAGSEGLQRNTGNIPDDFKTKQVMRRVRQAAMESHLRKEGTLPQSRPSISSENATEPRRRKLLIGPGKEWSEDQSPSANIRAKTYSPLHSKEGVPGFPGQQLYWDDGLEDASTTHTTIKPVDFVFSADPWRIPMTSFIKRGADKASREYVQTATRVLVSIVQSDRVLGPVYDVARKNPEFGARELRLHIRAALEVFADDLKNEARGYPELSASKLVRDQAGYAAWCVSVLESPYQPRRNTNEISDDEIKEQPVEQPQLNDDLADFRSFLTQSHAFEKLRAHTEAFCSPQPITSVAKENIEGPTQSQSESDVSFQRGTKPSKCILCGDDPLASSMVCMTCLLRRDSEASISRMSIFPDRCATSWNAISDQSPIKPPVMGALASPTTKSGGIIQNKYMPSSSSIPLRVLARPLHAISKQPIAERYTRFSASFNQGSLSTIQQQSATRVFVSVLLEDQVLMSLYEYARNRSDITASQLHRHIQMSMKMFAGNLSKEARGFVDISPSSLDYLANRAAEYLASRVGNLDAQTRTMFAENNADDESRERSIHRPRFVNLYDLRSLLTHSNAIRVLRAEANAFCKADSTPPDHGRLHQLTWREWRGQIKDLPVDMLLGLELIFKLEVALLLMIDAVFLLTDDLFIAMGYLEPPLEAGRTRIRSQCVSTASKYLCLNLLLTKTVLWWPVC